MVKLILNQLKMFSPLKYTVKKKKICDSSSFLWEQLAISVFKAIQLAGSLRNKGYSEWVQFRGLVPTGTGVRTAGWTRRSADYK